MNEAERPVLCEVKSKPKTAFVKGPFSPQKQEEGGSDMAAEVSVLTEGPHIVPSLLFSQVTKSLRLLIHHILYYTDICSTGPYHAQEGEHWLHSVKRPCVFCKYIT